MNVEQWILARTIYLTKHGSHAYGTDIATSDLDLRGICIPPKQYFLGFDKFEQYESKGKLEIFCIPDIMNNTEGFSTSTPTETVIYEIRKFIKLAADGNPSITEILFTDELSHIIVSPLAETLLAHRDLFLSKKMRHTFSGYAMSQLKRIETHRKWLLHPPKAPPTRKEFGLAEIRTIPKEQYDIALALIQKRVESWNIHLDSLEDASKIEVKEKIAHILTDMHLAKETEQFHTAGVLLGFEQNFMLTLEAERNFAQAQKNWTQYQQWITNRNAIRSELEAKYGYDCKHGMHLVRLMRMCKEILETGKVNVKRSDAEELISIRNGAWSYEKLIEWAKNEDVSMNEAYKKSTLPYAPNHDQINQLCIELIEELGW